MNGTITWLHFGATARMCGVDLMGMAGRWGAFEQPTAQMPSELPETLSGFAAAQVEEQHGSTSSDAGEAAQWRWLRPLFYRSEAWVRELNKLIPREMQLCACENVG